MSGGSGWEGLLRALLCVASGLDDFAGAGRGVFKRLRPRPLTRRKPEARRGASRPGVAAVVPARPSGPGAAPGLGREQVGGR